MREGVKYLNCCYERCNYSKTLFILKSVYYLYLVGAFLTERLFIPYYEYIGLWNEGQRELIEPYQRVIVNIYQANHQFILLTFYCPL